MARERDVVDERSIVAALLPLPEVAAVLTVTFGLMGYFNVPIYLTIAVMPAAESVTHRSAAEVSDSAMFGIC